jgi:hypothetical protein
MNGLCYADYERVVREMYFTRWFTNHGPKAKIFEYEVASCFNVGYAVAVASDILAIAISLTGVVEGSIYLHEEAPKDVLNAVKIAKIDYRVLHVRLKNNCIKINATTKNPTLPILLYEPKGNLLTAVKINNHDVKNVPVIIYSNAKCQFQGHGNALLHDNWIRIHPIDSWLDASGSLTGAIIMTKNENWANIFRNIRSSYGAPTAVDVKATCNGRFSELQAGLAFVAFKRLQKNDYEPNFS